MNPNRPRTKLARLLAPSAFEQRQEQGFSDFECHVLVRRETGQPPKQIADALNTKEGRVYRALRRLERDTPKTRRGLSMLVRESGVAAMMAAVRDRIDEEATRPTAAAQLSVVYFVQVRSGPIKIGVSADMLKRLDALQRSNPETLTPVLIIPGTRDDEQALHRAFAHLRLRGEWFSPGEELLAYIKAKQPGLSL